MKIDYSNKTLIVTLYDPDNAYHILIAVQEMEGLLCKKIEINNEDFDDFNELHIDVDDYYEYLTYRRLLLDYCDPF